MKPIVRYADAASVVLGQHALVLPVDHPSRLVSNKTWVLTTLVVRIWPDRVNGPRFETSNTIYVPVLDDEPPVQYAAKADLSLRPVT